MHTWPIQDAKARFSEFLQASLTLGPQIVTYRGTETAVLLPVAEWQRLKSQAPISLKAWLLDKSQPPLPDDFQLPARGHLRRRTPPAL